MKKKLITLLSFVIISTLINCFMIFYELEAAFLVSASITFIMTIIIFYYCGWFTLNDGNLFRQPLFILSILLPFYYFIIFGCWTWKGHGLLLSAQGFSSFLEMSKLPLLILASSVPLASIVNNIHRTIQTESQINSSKVKNNADAYYSHLKLFIETITSFPTLILEYVPTKTDKTRHVAAEVVGHAYIESNESVNTYEVKIVFPHKLFNKIFNSSQHEGAIYLPSKQFTDDIINAWNELNKDIIRIKNGDLLTEAKSLISIDLKIIDIMNILKVNTIRRRHSYIYNHENKYIFNTTYFSEPEIKTVVLWLYRITSDVFDLAGYSDVFESKHERLMKYLQSDERKFSKSTFQRLNEAHSKPPYLHINGDKVAAKH